MRLMIMWRSISHVISTLETGNIKQWEYYKKKENLQRELGGERLQKREVESTQS